MAGLFFWDLQQDDSHALELARFQARIAIEKDILIRRWAAGHGKVYVPIATNTPPNPYLADIPERDINTPSGTALTLMNPAYITRQLHEIQATNKGILGHITSLNPIRTANQADPWESNALRLFEQSIPEVSSIETIHYQPYLRLMCPLTTEGSCLKCHGKQGYKTGQIRGGISVSVPLAPIEEAKWLFLPGFIAGRSIAWLLGLGLIGLGVTRIKRHIQSKLDTELALKESQYRLNEAQRIAHIGCWEKNHQTGLLSWSDEVHRIFETQPDTFTVSSEAFLQLVHPDDRTRVQQAFHESYSTGKPYEITHRIQLPNGKIKHVHEHAEVFFDEKGAPRHSIGTVQDVTELHAAESSRRQQEELFRLLFYEARDPMLLMDESLKFIDCNDAAVAILGLSDKSQLKARNPLDISPKYQPDGTLSQQKINELVQEAINKSSASAEMTHRRQDHTEFIVDTSITTISMAENKALLIHWRDITCRRQAEMALKESEETAIALLNAIPESAFLMTSSGVVLAANDTLAKRLKTSRDKIIGCHAAISFPEQLSERRANHIREAIQTGQIVQFEDETEDKRSLENHIVPVKDSHGKVSRLAIMSYDVTEKKRAAQKRERLIKELQKAIGEVKTLSGLLPICSGCKKIRDDKGYWSSVETYFQQRSQAKFTHGLCPECTRKYFPDLDD